MWWKQGNNSVMILLAILANTELGLDIDMNTVAWVKFVCCDYKEQKPSSLEVQINYYQITFECTVIITTK